MEIYILLFVLLLLFLNGFWLASLLVATIIGSPIVYSDTKAIEDAFLLADLKKGQTVVDLGCGCGKTLILASKKFGAKGIGVDRSFFCFLHSKLNVWFHGESKNIKIILGNFQKAESELKKADVVYLYLLNTAMAKIEDWFFKTISQNTKVASLAFTFSNHQPVDQVKTFNLGKDTLVRLYRKNG